MTRTMKVLKEKLRQVLIFLIAMSSHSLQEVMASLVEIWGLASTMR